MRRILACLAILACAALPIAADAQSDDPIGDLISAANAAPDGAVANWKLRATLYHGGHGMRAHDASGCAVAPMRTVAVDRSIVGRRSIIFIKETVGLPLPGGGVHDGYWYASDVGGAIKGERIDLYTGDDASSMQAMETLNLKTLTVSKVGEFTGCPPIDGGAAAQVADAQ